MAVNRNLFQIWIGGKIPDLYSGWTKRVKQLNPEWTYKLWGDDLLDRYADDPFVANMLQSNERTAFLVDRLRVLLLRDDGGLYADVDCYPVRPLRMLDTVWDDPRVEFVAGMRSPDRRGVSLNTPGVSIIDNTVLASAKESAMAHRLCNLYRSDARRHTGFSMGREIIRNADGSTVLLSWPYFYSEQENMKTIFLHDVGNLASWLQPNKSHVPSVS